MNKKTTVHLGASLVVLSTFFYASYGIWVKLMGNFFDGYTASTLRSIFVLVVLVIIAVILRKFEPLQLKKNWLYLVGMVLSSLFTWGPQYFAIINAGVGMGLSVAYASSVIGMFFFGWLFAKEQFTKEKAISALLGIIGLVLIFLPSISSFIFIALAAAFLSGISSSANTVFAKLVHYGSTQSTIFLWIASVIANGFMAFILGSRYPQFQGQIEWLYLFLFAIVSVIASWLFVRGTKLIDAGAAGILGLMEIVFGVLFGVFLFQERPTLIVLVGIVLIIIATSIPYIKELKIQKLSKFIS